MRKKNSYIVSSKKALRMYKKSTDDMIYAYLCVIAAWVVALAIGILVKMSIITMIGNGWIIPSFIVSVFFGLFVYYLISKVGK